MSIPNIWKNKKCSKPPTSCNVFLLLLPGDDLDNLVHLFDHVSSMFHRPHPWGMSPAVPPLVRLHGIQISGPKICKERPRNGGELAQDHRHKGRNTKHLYETINHKIKMLLSQNRVPPLVFRFEPCPKETVGAPFSEKAIIIPKGH